MLRTTLLISLLASACHAQTANDWLLVPSKRAGPITAGATRADLVRLFGAANVTDGETNIADIGPLKCTRVFPKQKDSTATVVWAEGKTNKKIEVIVFCEEAEGSACRWRTSDGIGFGSTLDAIEKLNGRPFKLNGFGWDYGGRITSWEGGRLQSWVNQCASISLVMNPSDAGMASPDYGNFAGEKEVLSSTPALRKLDVRVNEIDFSFGDQTGCAAGGPPPKH